VSATVTGARVRAAAARVVDDVTRKGRSLDDALADHESAVADADRGLYRLLSYDALRYHWRLDAQLAPYLKRPLPSRDLVIAALLRIGLYQLTDTRVGQHAAVSLTVEAARQLGRPRLAGLVNAVLRNFLRDGMPRPSAPGEEAEHDHPAWLIERLKRDWPAHWEGILDANNRQAPMWLRVNRRRASPADYLARLAALRGESPEATGELQPGWDQAIRLASPWPVDELPDFAAGAASVQDAAAQVAAPWLLADGGLRILDACAAPGGKTGHLLERAPPGASVVAIDSDPERAAGITANLSRLGLDATVMAGDASKPQDWWDSVPFDRILVDAPCSATGVIRRHPDIKHLRRESDIDKLAGLQAGILEALWPLLAPGGRLLYVTCSVLRQENDDVVAGFMQGRNGIRESIVLPDNNIRALMERTRNGHQLLPGRANMDGFFFACMEKET